MAACNLTLQQDQLMSGTTAAAVYYTLLSGVTFVIDYFSYIETQYFVE